MKAIMFLWSTRICGQKKANNQICTGFVTKAQHSFIIMFTLSILSWWYCNWKAPHKIQKEGSGIRTWAIHTMNAVHSIPPLAFLGSGDCWGDKSTDMAMCMDCKVTLSTFISILCICARYKVSVISVCWCSNNILNKQKKKSMSNTLQIK